MKALQKISLLHGFGHLVTVLSMGLGAVSFVHVVKAAEPGSHFLCPSFLSPSTPPPPSPSRVLSLFIPPSPSPSSPAPLSPLEVAELGCPSTSSPLRAS